MIRKELLRHLIGAHLRTTGQQIVVRTQEFLQRREELAKHGPEVDVAEERKDGEEVEAVVLNAVADEDVEPEVKVGEVLEKDEEIHNCFDDRFEAKNSIHYFISSKTLYLF